MAKHRWWLPGAAAGLIASLAISACGSSGASQTSSSAAPPAASATTTTTTVTTSAQASQSPPATANTALPPTCRTRDLRLSLASAGGAAGTAYMYYELTNVGPAACSMIGYPGVAVLDANGKIVQHPARRGAAVAAPVRLVIVKPGRRARFLVNSTDVIPSPGCARPYTGTTLQVYPPNQRAAIRQPHTGSFCNLRVGPVQPTR